MINFSFSGKTLNSVLLFIFLFTFIIILYSPLKFYPDSEDYIKMGIIRSPLYPLFLNCIKYFSRDYFSFMLIFIQGFLGLSSVYFFIKTLKNNLKLTFFWYIPISLVLLMPYYTGFKIANSVLSEALSYPLYLIAVSFYFSALLKEQKKQLVYSLPFLFLLLLTRNQFLYLIPIGILLLFWISIKQKSIKKNIGLTLLFILLPVLSLMTDRVYHGIKHGHYVNTPWTGLHLITPAFFVAHENDVSIYKTEEERKFFNTVYAALQKKQLSIHRGETGKYIDNIDLYITEYSEIANHTIYDEGIKTFDDSLSPDEKTIKLEKLTKKMWLPLVFQNFKEWLKIYFYNIINAHGASIFLIALLFIYVVINLKSKNYETEKIILLSSALILSNTALVAIGMHTIFRFTFYNQWVLFLTVFVLLDYFYRHKKSL